MLRHFDICTSILDGLSTYTLQIFDSGLFCLSHRVVRDIVTSFGPYYAGGKEHGTKMMTKEALECLHEAAEAYMIRVFTDAQQLAIHAKRIAIQQKDMWLVRFIRGERLDTDKSLKQKEPEGYPNFKVGKGLKDVQPDYKKKPAKKAGDSGEGSGSGSGASDEAGGSSGKK